MGDLALEWGFGSADLLIVDDDLATDDGLQTAISLSLFTDRRAEDDDQLPAADRDLRGWWGDEFADVEGDRIGCRLWLLDRAARRDDVRRRAEELIREGLAWLIEDRVAEKLDVLVEPEGDRLAFQVTVYRPTGERSTFRFRHAWDAEAALVGLP